MNSNEDMCMMVLMVSFCEKEEKVVGNVCFISKCIETVFRYLLSRIVECLKQITSFQVE